MTGYGLVTGGDKIYERSLGMNINLWWGLGLLVFGGLMWAFAVRGRKAGQ
jgi:hypothetical protein